MINMHRGEIEAVLDGETYALCLTLGALAELEHAFGVEDLVALTERLEQGRLSAEEITWIIRAGLKGGGTDMNAAQVETMKTTGAAAGYVDIAMRLLKATFADTMADDHG